MTRTAHTSGWQEVSWALFETDPMHTACKENDCFDEYDRVARDVVAEIENGAELNAALETALGAWFGEDLVGSCDLTPIVEQLNTLAGEGGSR